MSLAVILLVSLTVGLLLVGLVLAGIYLFHLFFSTPPQEKQDDPNRLEQGTLLDNNPNLELSNKGKSIFQPQPKFKTVERIAKTTIKTGDDVDVQNYVFNIRGEFKASQLSQENHPHLISNCLARILAIKGTDNFFVPSEDIKPLLTHGLRLIGQGNLPKNPLTNYGVDFPNRTKTCWKIQIQFEEAQTNFQSENTHISFNLLISNSKENVPEAITIDKVLIETIVSQQKTFT